MEFGREAWAICKRTGNHHYYESSSEGQRIMQWGDNIEREESSVQTMRDRLIEISGGRGGRIKRKHNNVRV